VSFDSRNFSQEFAKAACEVFAAFDITAYVTKELRPVPMLSFMVRHFGCHGGVCVTASHNPPNYNGYKVYWQTGGQLVPPHDKKIIAKYADISDYTKIPHVAYADGLARGLIKEIGAELDDAYFAKVEKLRQRSGLPQIKIVYSPLHGTGGYPVTESLRRFGFTDVTLVPEQAKPDGNFPTVKSPNPEDVSALEMALALGRKMKADLVLATDPDTDRIGLAYRQGDDLVLPNGNQIACLLTEYVLSTLKEKGELGPDALVIKTIVTTEMMAAIADYYGVACEDTLTGFKWICDLIEQYETGAKKPYKRYVCGGEESYGFLRESFVRDKDGVSSCALVAEMTAYYKQQGRTLSDVLNDLYRRHGVYHEILHTETLPGAEGAHLIDSMMKNLRNRQPTKIAMTNVTKICDLENGAEYIRQGEKFSQSKTLGLPASNVLQFILEDGTKVSVRPSGTEPKIKFYLSVFEKVAPDSDDRHLAQVSDRLGSKGKAIIQDFVNQILSQK
jgi:phosphoglucomutase